MQYHYQGKVLEAADEACSPAGHAIRIQVGPNQFHYVWPEQVIRNGVPATDPYGHKPKGPTLHPERFRAGAQNGAATPPLARASGSGEVTLQEICQEAGIEPSLARRILRKNMPRPEGRWSFTAAEKDTVINLLRSKK